MTKLAWSRLGNDFYESGVDRGVLYLSDGEAAPWNGLVSVNESTSDGSQERSYIDGRRFVNRVNLGVFGASVSAVTYPPEFETYEGYEDSFLTAQQRKSFGFSYRTMIGDGKHYKLHLVYNAIATPSDRNFQSLGSVNSPAAFSWEFTTKPVKLEDAHPTSHFIVDSRYVYSWVLSAVEDYLYGNDIADARLPTIDQLLAVFESGSILRITNHGDGTFTATGPDDVVAKYSDGTFQIVWPSVENISSDTYRVRSL